jgi:hypothetical protein
LAASNSRILIAFLVVPVELVTGEFAAASAPAFAPEKFLAMRWMRKMVFIAGICRIEALSPWL